ncbi:(ZYRO0F03388g) [Zygosaccharomyces parabailii]|nr:(ZYRO0F03388g) [Zygosaccharomyces parabailii]CDH09649.1 uncharacterized protein ZBAI_01433 [Zygosaccharomyces bailii ISA1307]
MKSAAVEEKIESSPTSSSSCRNGFEETVVRGVPTIPHADLASQEYIQKLVTESLKADFVPPPGAGVADDSAFHYTSSFKARPQAEYFDFDEKYMYHPEDDVAKEKELKEGGHLEENVDDEEDVEMDIEVDEKEEDLQTMADAVSLCKTAFGDLIGKIDNVVLSAVSYKSTKMGLDQLDDEISDIMGIVKEMVPRAPVELNGSDLRLFQLQQQHLHQSALDASNSLTSGAYSSLRSDPCADQPNFGVILIKSPASVSQLWDEYTKIPAEWPVKDLFTFTLLQQGGPNNMSDIELITKRRTSIRQLEATLGSSWRNADKNFSRQINRRKKIWKAIEEGLAEGLPLHVCFHILETYVRDRGKGLSWYYNGVPFKLVDVYRNLPPNKRK